MIKPSQKEFHLNDFQGPFDVSFREGTPLKINMEPKHHPIEKENHLPNSKPPLWGSKMIIFQGKNLHKKNAMRNPPPNL